MKALIVEKENLKNNLRIVREIINKDKKRPKLIAVIKGNGYGLGLIEYANFLVDNGVDFFAVATVEEAIKLRKNGITQDILMMSSTAVKEDIELLIKNKIILTVGSKEAGEAVEEFARNTNQKIKVHLKIDTGFGRYGFIYSQKEEMIETIKTWKNIQIEGIFSHFSIAFFGDGKETKEQYDRLFYGKPMAVMGFDKPHLPYFGIDQRRFFHHVFRHWRRILGCCRGSRTRRSGPDYRFCRVHCA